MLTDDGFLSRLVGLVLDPLMLRYVVCAAVGAFIYAVFDWVQGTRGKSHGNKHNHNTQHRG